MDIHDSVCVVGAGAAGLITAHTLIQDHFTNVQILTKDAQPGGVWSPNRVYPGLFINK
jgi:cation diffusion facilitator CzcD-associated flavoprotein CzcO